MSFTPLVPGTPPVFPDLSPACDSPIDDPFIRVLGPQKFSCCACDDAYSGVDPENHRQQSSHRENVRRFIETAEIRRASGKSRPAKESPRADSPPVKSSTRTAGSGTTKRDDGSRKMAAGRPSTKIGEFYYDHIEKIEADKYFCHLCQTEGGASHASRHAESKEHKQLLRVLKDDVEGDDEPQKGLTKLVHAKQDRKSSSAKTAPAKAPPKPSKSSAESLFVTPRAPSASGTPSKGTTMSRSNEKLGQGVGSEKPPTSMASGTRKPGSEEEKHSRPLSPKVTLLRADAPVSDESDDVILVSETLPTKTTNANAFQLLSDLVAPFLAADSSKTGIVSTFKALEAMSIPGQLPFAPVPNANTSAGTESAPNLIPAATHQEATVVSPNTVSDTGGETPLTGDDTQSTSRAGIVSQESEATTQNVKVDDLQSDSDAGHQADHMKHPAEPSDGASGSGVRHVNTEYAFTLFDRDALQAVDDFAQDVINKNLAMIQALNCVNQTISQFRQVWAGAVYTPVSDNDIPDTVQPPTSEVTPGRNVGNPEPLGSNAEEKTESRRSDGTANDQGNPDASESREVHQAPDKLAQQAQPSAPVSDKASEHPSAVPTDMIQAADGNVQCPDEKSRDSVTGNRRSRSVSPAERRRRSSEGRGRAASSRGHSSGSGRSPARKHPRREGRVSSRDTSRATRDDRRRDVRGSSPATRRFEPRPRYDRHDRHYSPVRPRHSSPRRPPTPEWRDRRDRRDRRAPLVPPSQAAAPAPPAPPAVVPSAPAPVALSNLVSDRLLELISLLRPPAP